MRSRFAAFDHHPAAQLIQIGFLWLATHFHQIGFLNFCSSPCQSIRELSVIRHDQKAFTGIIESPYREDTLAAADQLHDCGTLLRVAHRSHVALWLVDDEITKALGTLQQLAVHTDVVARCIGLCAQLSYDLPVDLHSPGEDKFLRLPPRTDSRSCNDLLQPLAGLAPIFGHQSPSPG